VAAAYKKMKCLIAGSEGQLGRSLKKALNKRDISYVALSRKELDIADLANVTEVVKESSADIVINAAAYTNVEQAEQESEKAFLVNEIGTRNLAIASRQSNSRFLHFSTDYVFSGERNNPWEVDSAVNPLSTYGKSKLAGELAIQQEYFDNSIIIRTAWLYSPYGKNFYKTMLNLALKNDDQIKVVSDQFGQPTNASDLANLALDAISKNIPAGIYHGSNSGSTSWHEFATEIFRLAGTDQGRVIPIPSSEFATKAPRPSYSVLDNSNWLDFGVTPLRPWQEAVSDAYSSIFESMN
jgi:dTDP-4-dehydrorhamnose reductase